MKTLEHALYGTWNAVDIDVAIYLIEEVFEIDES